MKHLMSICLCLILSATAFPQIESSLKQYAETNGAAYIQPLVSGIGTSMNRGWYQDAHIPVIGLRFKISATVMMAPVLEEDRTFTATTEGVFTPKQTVKAPTIVGSENAVSVSGSGGSVYSFPGGFDLNMTGFAVPQLTVGSFMGTEVMARYFAAELGDSELGNLELTGYGARHSLSQYFPLFPVSVSVGAFWQRLNLGDGLVEFTTLHYGVQASKGFGIVHVYGGAGFDKTDAKVDYEFFDGSQSHHLSYELEGDNGLELTAGIGLNFFLVELYGDFSFGQRTVYSAGLAIGF